MAQRKIFIGFSGNTHAYFHSVHWLFAKRDLSQFPCGAYASIPRALLLLEGKMVCDHRDELRIGRLALDVRHRVAEVLLQHLDVAAVPGHLDRVADFRDYRPERGARSLRLLTQGRGSRKSRFIGLFIGLNFGDLLGWLYDSTSASLLSNF